jgi:hypothetical protein
VAPILEPYVQQVVVISTALTPDSGAVMSPQLDHYGATDPVSLRLG